MADYPDFDALTDPAAFKPAPPPPQAFADGTRPPWLTKGAAETPPGISGDAADAMADATPTSGNDDAFTAEQKALVEKSKHEQGLAEGKQADIERAQTAQQKELAPKYAELSSLMNRPKPERPQYGKAPPPPENPFIKGGGMEYMGIMSVFAGLAGSLGRSNATATMAAFGGAMKGYVEGNEQVFQQQSKEWEMANKKMLEDNQAKMDAYKEILEDRNMDITQKSNEIKLIAAKTGDEITYNMQNMNAHEKFGQAYEHMFQVNEQLKDRAEKMAMAVEDHRVKMEEKRGIEVQAQADLADRAIDGDPSALTQMGRSLGSINRAQNMISQRLRERGLTVQDMENNKKKWGGEVSYQRSAGTQAARVESASNEVAGLVPLAIESSKKLPRGKFVPLNKLIQGWQEGTSDPAYNEFLINNFSLTNAYARAMNPTGQPRVTERLEAKAEGILSKATSQQAYEVQARQLWKEVQTSKGAVAQTREGTSAPQSFPGDPKIGDRKQFKQGVGIWNGTTYVPETQ